MMLNDSVEWWWCWMTTMLNDAELRWGWTMMMLLTSVYYSYCDRLLSWRHAVIMSYHQARVPWRQGTRVLLSWLSTATLIEFNHCITLNSKYVCLYANYHFCCRCCCFIPFHMSYGMLISMDTSWLFWLEMSFRLNQWDFQPLHKTVKKKWAWCRKAKKFLTFFNFF